MITREQFMNGLLQYIDNEVIPALPTPSKWVAGTFIALASSKATTIMNELLNNPMIKTIGVVNEQGLIDNNKLMSALVASADRYGPMQINIPLLGTLTFRNDDVNKLWNIIGR